MIAATHIRNDISLSLRDRGTGWTHPPLMEDSGFTCWTHDQGRVAVFLSVDEYVHVNVIGETEPRLMASPAAPDLLERLGETLDGLGA